MAGNAQKPTSKDIFPGLGNAVVGQDKHAPVRMNEASGQPSGGPTPAHGQQMIAGKPIHHGSNRRRTVEVYGCVSRETAAEIERLRNQGGKRLSRSAVIAGLLEKGVQAHIDMQYGALLKPIIERAIDNRLKARDARFAALLIRIAFDTGQNRALLTNLLARSPGMSPDILDAILDQSGQRAKANLTHLSPQIAELITIVETWMLEKTEEGRLNSL